MSQYLEALKAPKDQILLPMGTEIMRSLPESIFLGTCLFAFLTQSFPIATLILAMLELGIFQNLFGAVSFLVSGQVRGEIPLQCVNGLPNANSLGIMKLLMREPAFPSASVFFISGILGYTMASVLNFKKELASLSNKEPEWKSRIPISMIFGTLFMITYAFWRLYNGCEGVISIVGSIIFGILVGTLLSVIHRYLFGRDSINFLGVPLLADRAAEGRPLYVCSAQT